MFEKGILSLFSFERKKSIKFLLFVFIFPLVKTLFFKFTEKVKIGGMGRIYKAFDIVNKSLVAIKIIADQYKDNPASLKRFIEYDGHNVQKLDHSGIVKVFKVNETKYPNIVMEYIDGDNITDILENIGRFSEKEVIFLGKQILEAINYAHKNGFLHRDIKPENIMIDDEQKIKILDFGLGKNMLNASLTKSIGIFGTVEYMPPEKLRGETVDVRSDIYSIGLTFYEMITGIMPFTGEIDDIIDQIIQKEPIPISDYEDLNVSDELKVIVSKCINI